MPVLLVLCLALAGLVGETPAAPEGPAAPAARPAAGERPRNLVLCIADGLGPASVTFARVAAGHSLALDEVLVGSVSTDSENSHITDSAAAATALACGVLTDNLTIGLDTHDRPVGNLVERARAHGFRTGVVTTTRVTHATPASFSAHLWSRLREELIAEQQITSELDLLLGGGAKYFLPADALHLSRRHDGRNLVKEARDLGWHTVQDAAGLLAARELPLLGLFADSHMPYELDLRGAWMPGTAWSADGGVAEGRPVPTLAHMTRHALELLAATGEPFVLVMEGGRIDHAGHENDLPGHLQEILAYDDAIAEVLDFVRDDGQTLFVGVSDHETGGLTLGRNRNGFGVWDWQPEVLGHTTTSAEVMVAMIQAGADVKQVFTELGGVPDPTPVEVELVERARARPPGEPQRLAIVEALGRPLALRSGLAWTTLGHTGVDVPLYAEGPSAERFRGHRDNVALGRLLQEVLMEDRVAR